MKSMAMNDDSKDDLSINHFSSENHPHLSISNIYIVVPAYNESKTIKYIINELKSRKFNIIVVDDGSTDNTYKIAKESINNSNGLLYKHVLNRGVGAAIKTGINAAIAKNAEIIVTFDADCQHDPDDVLNLCMPILEGKADVVNGMRDFNEMPTSKKLGNQIMNAITRIFYGVNVNDSQTGFKAFSKDAAQSLEINSRGFGVISEIMGEIKNNNLRMIEVPIKTIYTDYSMTKGTNLKVGLKILFRLIINVFKKV